MQHGADDTFIEDVASTGATEELKRRAFELLVDRNHRPTIERAIARLRENENEFRSGEVGLTDMSPLSWIARVRADFAFDGLAELRERALRLELPYLAGLLTDTLGKINRRELVRVIRRLIEFAPSSWRPVQQSHAIEQERTASIEEAQHTPFDEVIKKLKGATSINRLLILCEGSTDIPVFEELIGQIGEVPELLFNDVGGWPGLRNKDPNVLLLGCKAAIVVMDGDEGRMLTRRNRPLTEIARAESRRLAAFGIELRILQRYGIENYFPQGALECILRQDLTSYFPVPHDIPIVQHLSRDRKDLWYRFRRWIAPRLQLRMPSPRESLYSKSQNRDVARHISLQTDLAQTDLFEIVHYIADRAIELRDV